MTCRPATPIYGRGSNRGPPMLVGVKGPSGSFVSPDFVRRRPTAITGIRTPVRSVLSSRSWSCPWPYGPRLFWSRSARNNGPVGVRMDATGKCSTCDHLNSSLNSRTTRILHNRVDSWSRSDWYNRFSFMCRNGWFNRHDIGYDMFLFPLDGRLGGHSLLRLSALESPPASPTACGSRARWHGNRSFFWGRSQRDSLSASRGSSCVARDGPGGVPQQSCGSAVEVQPCHQSCCNVQKDVTSQGSCSRLCVILLVVLRGRQPPHSIRDESAAERPGRISIEHRGW